MSRNPACRAAVSGRRRSTPWEGSGSINASTCCARWRASQSLDAWLAEIAPLRGDGRRCRCGHRRGAGCVGAAPAGWSRALVAEQMALLLSAALLVQNAPDGHRRGFVARRQPNVGNRRGDAGGPGHPVLECAHYRLELKGRHPAVAADRYCRTATPAATAPGSTSCDIRRAAIPGKMSVSACPSRQRQLAGRRAGRSGPRAAGPAPDRSPDAPPQAQQRDALTRAAYFDGCTSLGWTSSASKSSMAASGGGRREVLQVVVGEDLGRPHRTTVAVVPAVDANHLEVRRRALDLTQEVLGGEPALAQPIPAVLLVAASRTPASTNRARNVDINTVSPGSSSSNSSMHTSRLPAKACTAFAKPSAPIRLVYSTKVPKAFGPGCAMPQCNQQVVLPTRNRRRGRCPDAIPAAHCVGAASRGGDRRRRLGERTHRR